MRQVPRYCILGGGAVATHFAHYFSLQGISFWQWKRSRELTSEFFQELQNTTHLLILVSDSAIAQVLDNLPSIDGQHRLHFSGVVTVPGGQSAHPLMGFGKELYSLQEYQNIPFILRIEESEDKQSELLEGLPNPRLLIPKAKASLYHALCVMTGNFPMILWNEVFKISKNELGLPAQVFTPFLERVFQNTMIDVSANLSGPLVRGDWKTVDQNVQALEGQAIQKIYLAFCDLYREQEKSVTERNHPS
jgi:hypothetical protein